MNRMVYALFTPWLLPKIKHAFPMSSPSFVPSSIVSRPSHWMIRHRFPLSDSDRVALGARKQGANGNPSETWSWFVTTDKDARLRGSLFLFHQTLLSYPFCRFSRASVGDCVRAWWLQVRWGPILRSDHPPTLKSELSPKAQEFQSGP